MGNETMFLVEKLLEYLFFRTLIRTFAAFLRLISFYER